MHYRTTIPFQKLTVVTFKSDITSRALLYCIESCSRIDLKYCIQSKNNQCDCKYSSFDLVLKTICARMEWNLALMVFLYPANILYSYLGPYLLKSWLFQFSTVTSVTSLHMPYSTGKAEKHWVLASEEPRGKPLIFGKQQTDKPSYTRICPSILYLR